MEKAKLIIAIVWDRDAGPVIEQLVAQDYRVTRVASTGGFLRRGVVTLLIGAEEQRVDSVIDLLREMCRAPEPGLHGATIFVVDVPHYEQV